MFETEAWYQFLSRKMRLLVDESFYLLEREEMDGSELPDYSFVVFPAAKAYEGFVKKYIVEIGLLPIEKVESRMFRVGKSLNPALPVQFRNSSWVWDKLKEQCGDVPGPDNDVAEIMWKAWRLSRNKLFHYFPRRKKMIDISTARARLELIVMAMDKAVACKV